MPATTRAPRMKRAAPGSLTPSTCGRVSDQPKASAPTPSRKASVMSIDVPTASVSASPMPTRVTDETNDAAAPRWPRQRATNVPGSSTTSVAAARRSQRPKPVSGKSRAIPRSAATAAGVTNRHAAPAGTRDGEHARRLYRDGERERPAEQTQPRPVGVEREVHVPQDRLDAQAVQQRPQPVQERVQTGREEDERAGSREQDEGELDPEVAADRIPADGQREAHRREDERGGTSQRALQDHGSGHRAPRARMAARRLVDPRCVSAE